VLLQDEVRHAAAAQLLTHRQPGLACADNEDLNLLARHPNLRSYGQSALVSLNALLRLSNPPWVTIILSNRCF
jgi:hypothetical protein